MAKNVGLDAWKARLSAATAGFSAGQKMAAAAVGVLVMAGLWMFSSWASQPNMSVLFSDLEPRDASQIVDQLEAEGTSYELTQAGRTIRVPRDQVYPLRLSLSAEGLPTGGAVGYSILDNQGLTTSEFQQRVGYQRALEGELVKTIRSMSAVETATVHLSIPKNDLFTGDDVHASASVLVHSGNETLTATQVQAITNLVASSVEGLVPDQVTVADSNGLVLAAPGQGVTDAAAGNAQMSRTADYEKKLATEISQLIVKVVGPGNASVNVNADLDFDQSNRVIESYEPAPTDADDAEQLLLEEGSKAEEYLGAPAGAAGVLGEEELPENAEGGNTEYRLNEANRKFAVNRVVEEVQAAPGNVNRLSVAVLVNEDAVTPAQLGQIEQAVTVAAGLNAERGDAIAVTRLPFDTSAADAALDAAESDAAAQQQEQLLVMARTAALVVLVLVVLFLAWRSMKKGTARRVSLGEPIQLGYEKPRLESAETAALESADSSAALALLEAEEANVSSRIEAQVADLIDQQPDQVAQLLRNWLGEKELQS